MTFNEDTKNRAFIRSGLKCECSSLSCGHIEKCGKQLFRDEWHASHIIPVHLGGDNSLINCMVICSSCYSNQAMVHKEVNLNVVNY